MVRVVGDAEELVEGLEAPVLDGTVELQAAQGRLGNAGDPVRAAGQRGHVVEQDADDLAKAQGDDGQIVPPQPQHREAEQEAEGGRHQAGDGQALPEAQAEVGIEQGVAVGADRVEADVTEIQQAGEAHHHVQAQAQHDVDEGQGGQIDGTARGHEGPADRKQQHQDGGDVIELGRLLRARQHQLGEADGEAADGGLEQATDLAAHQLEPEHQGGAPQQPGQGDIEPAHHQQAGAIGLQLEAEQPEGEHQQHQAGDTGMDKLFFHTFSTSGRPRMPVGIKRSTKMSRAKAITSLYSVLR